METRRQARARPDRERRARAVPRVAVAGGAHLHRPTRAPPCGDERSRRSCTRSWRRWRAANVMIGHLVAYYGAADRYLGMLAATLGEWELAEEHFERAIEAQPRDGREDVARPHRLRVRAHAARARRPSTEPAPSRCWRRPTGSRGEIGMRALRKRIRRSERRSPTPPSLPDGAVGARGADPAAGRARAAATARSAPSCSSASTPPPTTCAASCARPVARTAPRRPPTPTVMRLPTPSDGRYDRTRCPCS